MSLGDAIRQNGRKGPRCSFTVMRESLDPADRADLDACMADEDIKSTAIARGLTTVGVRIAPNTVQRHRRRECGCEPR